MRWVLGLMLCGCCLSAEPIKVVILGDSTVCNYPEKDVHRGWGQMLPPLFGEGVTVVNLAASGRSTKTFMQEGRLTKALAEHANYALIQFGHNDSHGAGKPEATDAATDFRDYLRQYVEAFRVDHTVPILVTPMHRRLFKDGHPTLELLPYAEAIKAVADELKVPVVDLHAASGVWLDKLGEADSEVMFAPGDRTHFVAQGAEAMAGLVADGLKTACPELAQRLK